MNAWIFIAGVVVYALVTLLVEHAARVIWSVVRA